MIRVLIERYLLEQYVSDYHNTIVRMKQKASHMSGYLSGEILVDSEDPLRCLVMSNWQDIASWENWAQSKERKQSSKIVRKMLTEDETVTVYQSASINQLQS